jgi:fibronectin type 3 domain-containing protein
VSGVSPNSGSTAGGTAVTITGTNFLSGATVTFGGTAATNVVVVSATEITASTPAAGAGAVTVTVTVNGQSGSLASGFTYVVIPTVSGVSPNTGSTAGGTAVTITGTNFAAGATVTFGGTAATNVVVVSATEITATTPAGGAGAVTVTVTVNGQSGSLASGFSYGATPTAPTGLTVTAGGPGPIYVNGQGYYNTTSLTTHTTAAFNSTGGDLILLFASSHNDVTFTPSDSFGNTWISIAGPTSTVLGNDLESQVWYAPNPIVGAGQTITMNLSSAQPLVMSIVVVKGSDIAAPINATSLIGSDNGTDTVNVISPSITTTGTNDLLVGFVKASGTVTFTAGPGFTIQPATTVLNLTAETEPVATPGSYDATFTLSGEDNWQSVVTAVTNNPNQTTLSWTASTETGGTISEYLVQRCQGAGCTSFAQVGTTTTTTFNDTGLTASTSYSYRVQAEDTTGTLGPFASVVTITMPALVPTPPGTLTAAADRQGPIDLTWTASTSSIGIAHYAVQRCAGAGCANFAQIGTATGTAYSDAAVASSTTYSYIVQAVDTAGNVSPFSNIATATTVGSQPPTAPSNLTATAVSTNQINLSWTASTSSLGLANYVVQRCQGVGCSSFAQIATPTATTYTDTGLASGTSYSYQVEAIDIEGNLSPFSNVASATTLSSSTTITYVQGAYASPQTPQSSVSVTFTAAQAAGDLNVVAVGWNDSTATVSSVTDKSGNTYARAVGPTIESGVASQSIYYAKNIAAAAAGANSVTVAFSAAAVYPDIRILEYTGADPNSPVDVTAASTGNSATSSSGSATTTNATDLIFGANLVQTGTTGPGSGFTSRLLTSPDGDIAEDAMVTTAGSYSATATLASGEWIMQMVAFRTATCGGGPPSAPSNLTATAAGVSQINLNWTASTSCAGIAHYVVQRCQGASCTSFAQVGTATATTFSDTGLTSNTSYSYQVQAVDNTGNSSSFSGVAAATTLAISISPRVTALTFTRTQQFTSAGSTSVTWSVDGTVGGSATSGTITTSGLYTPPSAAGTHMVTVTTSNQLYSASATVYITNYAGTFTYHNDNLRTGQNLSETVLTLSNVNQTQFGKLFSYPIDGMAFASPLYVANVSIPGQGYHNVVYVATENDSVYAFDADGVTTTPLWHVSFLKSGVTTVPCGDTGECGDILTQIGITSTPVIDPTGGTIYVVAATKEGASTWVQRLHALDITTGAEKFGGPVVIQASVPGTGSGSAGGNLAFDPLRENQRPGLLLSSGVVYLAWGSHGDNSPWHGWVIGYNSTTLQQTMVYCVTPDGNGGGIWQGGGGLATDATGDIYYVTSNGDFNVNTGGVDYGDTVQKLSPSGTVVDYFTPHDQSNMDVNNLDLGAGGPVMLVDQTTGSYPHLLISAGKSGTIYVIDRDNLGHYNASNDNQIVQSLPNALPNGTAEAGNFSTPVFFNGYVYFGAVNDVIRAFQLTNGLLSTAPTSQTAAIYGIRGASFAISANTASNGILWALQNNGASADNDVGNPGVLFAYNADNLATELYDTTQAGSRDTLDNAVKFSIPLVANGKVFVAGQTQLTAFGLLP